MNQPPALRFYHLYPLGAAGAPSRNDLTSQPQARLRELEPWLEHAASLGCNALYLGPVCESSAHGYDTVDYFHVDRRLGDDDDLAQFVAQARERGLRVVLDAVFGHVGRDFWAFRELRERLQDAPHRHWFRELRFEQGSPFGDPFRYAYWKDAPELPRLALEQHDVREHLFAAVDHWRERFGIGGLRLDTADWLDFDFLAALREHCDRGGDDFVLLGEVVHGDYRRWVHDRALHSVTNYEAYKGLWSAHAAKNFFEIGHTLEREFGPHGSYRGMPLYGFADNHDVDRVASRLPDRAQLFSLYALLFTMPGWPSVYSGSEWGLRATRSATDDRALRPRLDLDELRRTQPGDLCAAISRLSALRAASEALQFGDYQRVHLASEQLAFLRTSAHERVLVVVNGGSAPAELELTLPGPAPHELLDLLDPAAPMAVAQSRTRLVVPPRWARVLRLA